MNMPIINKSKIVKVSCYILIGIIILLLASNIIPQITDLITDLVRHILKLFRIADIRPSHGRGFSAFIQLLMIAVFCGWAFNRFKNKNK